MYRRVVELDSLSYADRAASQNQYHRLAGTLEAPCLAHSVAGGVEVWGLGVELGGAGVNHLVAELPAWHLLCPAYMLQRPVGVAKVLGQCILFL